MAVRVVVVSSNVNNILDEGQKLFVDLCDTEEELGNTTVKELREKINNKLLQEFPPKPGCFAGSVYEVHFKEQKLEEDSSLSDHGIQHMSMVEVKISTESDVSGDVIYRSGDLTEDKTHKRRRSKDLHLDMEKPKNYRSSKDCCLS